MDDLTELLKRIIEFGESYKQSGLKQPLFRITPYEHRLLLDFNKLYLPEYFGDIPPLFGVDFELVGKPVLFNGAHIRSDSGINIGDKEDMNYLNVSIEQNNLTPIHRDIITERLNEIKNEI